MIDLHCHYLPGVDDGPELLPEALALARAAYDNGIRACALTPHVHPGRYPNTRTRLQQDYAAFNEAVRAAGIDLNMFLAGEVRLAPESLALFQEEEVPYLGSVDGYRIVLLEFPHETIPLGSERFVGKLLDMQIRPLIAHPERNKAVMREPGKMRAFVDMGCWLQLTAGSLCGRFGGAAQKTARALLDDELAWVMATDAHNLKSRPPDLAEGRAALEELVGARLARRMVQERPARILGLEVAP
ncbi:MAG: CpsB/CapC family capsule biosynthesis tyrosine phosphatase [Pseudomonadota bacterium]